jgi:sulfur relay (sulfurtransferase) complex TusBCD TusD component (DsrE family)
MNYTVCLPSRPSLRPNAEAARRLAELLRELHASQAVITLAEGVAKAAEEDEPVKQKQQPVPSR